MYITPQRLPFCSKTFLKYVPSLCKTVEEFGNPCLDATSSDLLTLDSKDVMDNDVVDALKNYMPEGTKQFERFLSNLEDVHHTLKRNNFKIFDKSKTKISKKLRNVVKRLQSFLKTCSSLAK